MATLPERDELGRLKPGGPTLNPLGQASGNHPKNSAELRALAAMHAPDAIAEIKRIMTTARSPRVRLIAAGMLLDRAFGKPVEAIAMRGEFHRVPFEQNELARRVVAILDPRFATVLEASRGNDS